MSAEVSDTYFIPVLFLQREIMRILALDPGPTNTAWLIYDSVKKIIHDHRITESKNVSVVLPTKALSCIDVVACEHLQCFGMAVGKEVFETAYWIGEFRGKWPGRFERIYRSEEKMHLCHSMRAKDGNIRQALIDRFPATGGGKIPQVGIKSKPGPLFGMAGDMWSALAVAVVCAETKL